MTAHQRFQGGELSDAGSANVPIGSASEITEENPFWLRPAVIWTARIAILVGGLLLWEFASGRWIRLVYVSRPSLVAERLWHWIESGEIWMHLAATLHEAILGFLLGALAGMAMGLLLGRNEFLARVLGPFIVALNSLPKVALAPLFILWFGIGLTMKVVLTVVIVFFLVFYNTFMGVRDVDEDLVNIIKTMGASRLQILRKVVIPSALLWVSTGLRISIPYALIGAVVGEIFASNRGIGYLIQSSGAQFDTAGVFAGLILLVIVSTTFSALLTRIERSLFRWRVLSRPAG